MVTKPRKPRKHISGQARSEALRARFLSAITETTEPEPARPAQPKAANKRGSIRAVLIDLTRHAVEDIILPTLPTADGAAGDVELAHTCGLIGCEEIGIFPLSDLLGFDGRDWCEIPEGRESSADYCIYGHVWPEAVGQPAAVFFFDEHNLGLPIEGKALIVGYDNGLRDISVSAREVRSVVIWADDPTVIWADDPTPREGA